MNPYDTLGVKPDAAPDEIKKAFRRKAKKVHADKGGSHEDMVQVNRAYAVLANPARRKQFDETGCDEDAATMERKIAGELQRLFVMLVESVDFKHEDLIRIARDSINAKIQTVKAERKTAEAGVKRFTDAAARISRTDSENIIQTAFEAEQRKWEAGVTTCNEAITMLEGMRTQLAVYKWAMDEREQSWPSFTGFTNVATTFAGMQFHP